jgi:anti-anti-sigma regulatory factor
MDSSGLNALIVALTRSAELGHSLVLRAPPAQVGRLLKITGTDQMFALEPPD